MLAYRDKQVTPAQIGQQLKARYVLGGSLRRAGNRIRINTQLVDTHTDHHCNYAREVVWIDRARVASQKAVELSPEVPEVMVAQAWILYAKSDYEDAIAIVRAVIQQKRDCEGAYYLLTRALFASGQYQEIADIAEAAIESSGDDYNVYVPISNALGALGKAEAAKNLTHRRLQVLESHLREVPEDARARILLASDYAELGRVDDAMREANLAMLLRPNEATVHYNAACTFCSLNKKAEAMEALTKAWKAGFWDSDWARRDPDLGLLHGDPEFEKLYPETGGGTWGSTPD